jgi:2-dehydropantoate 2-reductase
VTRSVAVLGAGAIGAPIAGLLASAGHDMTLVDPWVDHVQAVKSNGLRVTTGPWDDPDDRTVHRVRALHLHELAAERPKYAIVFLACKSYDSTWLAQFIEPYLADDGVIVSVQNSMNDLWITPVVGAERDIGCVITSGGGELVAPGDTWRDLGHNALMLGELDGAESSRLDDVIDLLSASSTVTSTTNIWGAKWTKLVQNAMAGAYAGLTGGRTREILGSEAGTAIAHEIGIETVEVGRSLGYQMQILRPGVTLAQAEATPTSLLGTIGSVGAPGKEAHNMITQDILRGRRTEIDFINGLVARKGAEHGVATPLNDQVVELMHRIEAGELTPNPANLDLLDY